MARILVIDDEDDVRAVIRAILEAGGHAVETASDGCEGVHKVQQQSFDLVLCDSVLPKKSGEQIVGEIRQISDTVPIITMSGRPPAPSVHQAFIDMHGPKWKRRRRQRLWIAAALLGLMTATITTASHRTADMDPGQGSLPLQTQIRWTSHRGIDC